VNIEDAKRLLKPGVLIQYAPVRGDNVWWNGVVDGDPWPLGGAKGQMVVHLRDLDPAYEWAARRGNTIRAASIDNIRLRGTTQEHP
jgi:hypothetical protein